MIQYTLLSSFAACYVAAHMDMVDTMAIRVVFTLIALFHFGVSCGVSVAPKGIEEAIKAVTTETRLLLWSDGFVNILTASTVS